MLSCFASAGTGQEWSDGTGQKRIGFDFHSHALCNIYSCQQLGLLSKRVNRVFTWIHESSHGVRTDLTSQISLHARVNSRHLRILTDDWRLCHPTGITQHWITTATYTHILFNQNSSQELLRFPNLWTWHERVFCRPNANRQCQNTDAN